MIKIKTGLQKISINELKQGLGQLLPAYKYKKRGEKILIVKTSALIGVVIVQKKRYIQLSGNFPEFYHSTIFAIVTILLGIIFPVILYFIFLHCKMKKAEKEVHKQIELLMK